MRHQSREFIEKFLKEKALQFDEVLEVGSADVNGNISDLFKNSNYHGIDMRPGNNVDEVMNGHDMKWKNEFDLVICIDTLEHDDKFWITVKNIFDAVKHGGWVIFGVPGRGCPYHEHPHDYWRFMEDSFKDFFLSSYTNIYYEVQHDDPSHSLEDELYGYGRKP